MTDQTKSPLDVTLTYSSDERRDAFVKLEYEKGLSIVHHLHEMRLMYQKFYVALVASIISVSMLIQKLKFGGALSDVPAPTKPLPSAQFHAADTLSVENLIGLLFLLSAIIGFIVVTNLAAIRRNEVFWMNNVIRVRRFLIREFKFEFADYDLGFARAIDINSADFQTIVGCSITNIAILWAGLAFLFDETRTLAFAIILLVSALLYGALHFGLIHRTLGRPLGNNDRTAQ